MPALLRSIEAVIGAPAERIVPAGFVPPKTLVNVFSAMYV